MALRDLQTNLKSLRYGKDTLGGGTSREPYVTTSINTAPGDTGGPDFTLRANTLQHVLRDESRLAKYLFSTKGLQFTAKQNLLSRVGVKTQASGFVNEGTYLPTSTLLQAAGNPFGTHLLKQGLDPTRNTSPNASPTTNPILDLLGVGQGFQDTINRVGGVPAYAQIVKQDQSKSDNRLVNLKQSKISLPQTSGDAVSRLFGGSTFNQILNEINPFKKGNLGNAIKTIFTNKTEKNSVSKFDGEILRYGGGPGSALGIGQTSIKRYYTSVTNGISNGENGYFKVLSSGVGIEGRYVGKNGSTTVTDFRDVRNQAGNKALNLDETSPRQNILSKSLPYNKYNIENRVNLGNPGKRNKNVSSYKKGLGEPLDKINALPIYKSSFVTTNKVKNDLVKFRIGVIDNKSPDQKTYIHFRAFLDSMDDQYSAQWNAEKYMGRGENFYRYGGYDRNISLSWTVAAQSKDELIPMYKKLNYLASTLTPDYTNAGYMAGNLITLTVGGYLYEQPGILTQLNYTVPQESPWEISIPDSESETDIATGQSIISDKGVKELPHMIKVSGFNFIPIHKFVPRIQKNEFGTNGEIVKYGNERYIALENDTTQNNYDETEWSFNPNSENSFRKKIFTIPSKSKPVTLPDTESQITAPIFGVNN